MPPGRSPGSLFQFVLLGYARPALCAAGLDGDVHSESFELAYEPLGLLLGGSATVVPIRSEILVGDPVADNVVVGDKDVVAGSADCQRSSNSPSVRG